MNGTRVHQNYNDMIDDVYERERNSIDNNLMKLDHLIQSDPELFAMSFKRSLQSHISERKRLEA